MIKARFVIGTGTDVGKTIVCGLLCLRLSANYYKPIQSGAPTDRDFIGSIIGHQRTFTETYRLKEPLSPNQAASLEQRRISLADITVAEKIPRGPLIVEGAGGLLSPINERETMIDMITHLQIPTILVARTGLGTITHTLQSIHVLAHRNIFPTCIILFGQPHGANLSDIAQRSGIKTFNYDHIKHINWEDI